MTKNKTDYDYISYIIGAMQITAEGDSGLIKREKICKELLLRNVLPINPVILEVFRIGMSTEELHKKMEGWIASGNWKLFKKYTDLLWLGETILDNNNNLIHTPGDFDYVEMSDFVTALYNKGDVPCGTFAEAGYAYKIGIPVYLITDVPKKRLRRSFLGFIVASGGEVFKNLGDYLNFVDKKYKLKRKENEIRVKKY